MACSGGYVAYYICYDILLFSPFSEQCTLDEGCDDSKADIDVTNKQSTQYNPELLRMLKRILDRRSYRGRK